MSGAFCFVLGGGSWGRKDGFPGADGSTVKQVSGAAIENASAVQIYGASGNTLTEGSTGVRRVPITTGEVIGDDNTSLEYAIKNPLAFIYTTTTPSDWYTNNQSYQDNTLWGYGGEKSAYDPCPEGWRVPTGDAWGDLSTKGLWSGSGILTGAGQGTKVSNGGTYKNLAWYPSSGVQFSSHGGLIQVGQFSYVSSMDPQASMNRYLSSSVNSASVSAHVRALGMSIRCVQE